MKKKNAPATGPAPEQFTLDKVDLLGLKLVNEQALSARLAHETAMARVNAAVAAVNAFGAELSARLTENGKYELLANENGNLVDPETGVGMRRLKRAIIDK